MAETKTLPEADLELVSAYLDNQLDSHERTALEARFEREPGLRQARDELGTTVALLRELEPVRPPRSFTLDAATVQPRPFWQFPVVWLRAGSVFAALLLAITLTLDVVGQGASSAGAPMSTAAEAPAASAPEAADTSGGAASRLGAPTSAAAAAEESAPMMSAAEAPAEATAAPAAESAPQMGDLSIAAAEPTSAGGDSAAEQAQEGAPTTEAAERSMPEADALSANSGVSDGQTSSPDTTSLEAYGAEEPQVVSPSVQPLLLIEIALGALALLLLLASFWVARRQM